MPSNRKHVKKILNDSHKILDDYASLAYLDSHPNTELVTDTMLKTARIRIRSTYLKTTFKSSYEEIAYALVELGLDVKENDLINYIIEKNYHGPES